MSDDLCQLALGGEMEKRKLFTDADVMVVEAERPMILTGIGEFVRRPDLADRIVRLACPKLGDDVRRRESDFWDRFGERAPRLLGAVLDVVAGACHHLATEFRWEVASFVPGPGAARNFMFALHEWLGLAWYRLRGWI